jgi:hypothetical protein
VTSLQSDQTSRKCGNNGSMDFATHGWTVCNILLQQCLSVEAFLMERSDSMPQMRRARKTSTKELMPQAGRVRKKDERKSSMSQACRARKKDKLKYIYMFLLFLLFGS